jgi:alkylhydroperoxidase family enzyme
MARIEGVTQSKASPFVRLAYYLTKRRLGKVIEPIGILAHHPRLLRGVAHMELAQEAAKSVDPVLKTLASVRVATLVGCPF